MSRLWRAARAQYQRLRGRYCRWLARGGQFPWHNPRGRP